MSSVEQQARDLLERIGVPDAQSYTAGSLVELCALMAPTFRAKGLSYVKFDTMQFKWSEGKVVTCNLLRAGQQVAMFTSANEFHQGQTLNVTGIEGWMQISQSLPISMTSAEGWPR